VSSKHDQVRIYGEPHHASRPALTAGVVNGRDEVPKRHCLLLAIGLHGIRIRGVAVRRLWGVHPARWPGPTLGGWRGHQRRPDQVTTTPPISKRLYPRKTILDDIARSKFTGQKTAKWALQRRLLLPIAHGGNILARRAAIVQYSFGATRILHSAWCKKFVSATYFVGTPIVVKALRIIIGIGCVPLEVSKTLSAALLFVFSTTKRIPG